jgi:hypothetical protein
MPARKLVTLCILVALAVATGEAKASAYQHATAPPSSSAPGITLSIKHLSSDRGTVSRIARYYYGSAQMNFAIYAANPWLAGYPATRSLVSLPQRQAHASIRIPCLSGARPLGPC